MHAANKRQIIILFIACLIFLSSCATFTGRPTANEHLAYTAKDDKSIFSRHSPVFVIEYPRKRYNLIGTPSARITNDMKEDIFVDHEKPTIYTGKRIFKTSKSEYTNLIYRIHFEKVPFGLIPFYLTAGKNVGLMTEPYFTQALSHGPGTDRTCGILPLFWNIGDGDYERKKYLLLTTYIKN